jgi:hypothetical protein
MHLGLNGPFVPHKLIPVNVSHVPSMKFQMAPRLKLLNVLWILQEKGAQI